MLRCLRVNASGWKLRQNSKALDKVLNDRLAVAAVAQDTRRIKAKMCAADVGGLGVGGALAALARFDVCCSKGLEL